MVYLIAFIVIVIFVVLAIRSHFKDRVLKSTSPSALLITLKESVRCSDSISSAKPNTQWDNVSYSCSLAASSDSASYSPSPSEESDEETLTKEDLKELLVNLIKRC